MAKYDFSGYATKNDIQCADGRTIRQNAFIDNDGQIVPLVWQHFHDEPSNVLGHALLENRDDGVYMYGAFNDTEKGRHAKALVEHGDVNSLSIYANKLKQRGGDVLHGMIREVSLVLSGANPGAHIETLAIEHSEDSDDEEAIVRFYQPLELYHADEAPEKEDDEKTIKDVFDEMTDDQKNVVYYMIGQALEDAGMADEEDEESEETVEHAEKEEEPEEMADKEKTVKDVFDEMTEEQKNVVYFMIGQTLEDAGVEADEEDDEEDEAEHSDLEGENDMKYNVFDNEVAEENTLSHADMEMIIDDAKRLGSLKESFLAHAGNEWGLTVNGSGAVTAPTYGVANIDYLFPDAHVDGGIQYVQRRMDWVSKVLNAVHRSPFARIKSIYADLTIDEARAKGYIKGKMKKEQVFGLLKRTTSPTTVYKKQKLDRDDVLDITDFDIVAELKKEMRVMLDEEIATALLIGDGRSVASDDKINETCIRPIWTDDDLFTIKHVIEDTGLTPAEKAEAIVDGAVLAMDDYEGTGSPVLYAPQAQITQMLLLKDKDGHRMYRDMRDLAAAMNVSDIVAVSTMKNKSRTDSEGNRFELAGIIVNLTDYSVGADKGGSVNMFDDFDIDYNQMKYLIETRCSGSLTKPYSAIALEVKTANA